MGYILPHESADMLIERLSEKYRVFAPMSFAGGATFSGLDCVRYGEVRRLDDIVFDRKSEYSFKEALLPVCETFFYYTEDQVKEPDAPEKDAVIFLRSCDLHAVKRLDTIYLENGPEDHYYKRLRDRAKFVLMGCDHAFDSCFCVDMGSNISDDYDMSMEVSGDDFLIDLKDDGLAPLFDGLDKKAGDVAPSHVTSTPTRVHIPADLTADVARSSMWNEYDSRCINCGRCNFVCPTCTCFTMQDIFYKDNGRAGERRRVHASCMVDGFTDVAGGGSYRKKNGERMRFKALHKALDFRQRFGFNMCVGCGRCDDVCPEYISFSNILNKLEAAQKEVRDNAEK